jgi:hypothetical protein
MARPNTVGLGLFVVASLFVGAAVYGAIRGRLNATFLAVGVAPNTRLLLAGARVLKERGVVRRRLYAGRSRLRLTRGHVARSRNAGR